MAQINYDICVRVTGKILFSYQRNNHRSWEKLIALNNTKPFLCLTSNITIKHSYICVTIFREEYLCISLLFAKKIQKDATVYQNFITYLYEAQHVSGDTPPNIRSLKLH